MGPFSNEESCARLGWKTCSVNENPYLEMLRNKVISCLLEFYVLDKIIFMQDGALAHVATEVKQFLKNKVTDERVLSR